MTYNRKKILVAAAVAAVALFIALSCSKVPPSDISKASLIPKPVSVIPTGEFFTMKPGMVIYVMGESSELLQIGNYLAGRLNPATGFNTEVMPLSGDPGNGNILLTLSDTLNIPGKEGYELEIATTGIRLVSSSPEGIFRGVQTLRQLFPPAIELSEKQEIKWQVPTGKISDHPVYSYRGAMLDVARHFFSVDDVKRFIDLISYYKINHLHLHLSDDQGWRIEIKSWPRLALHGGSTEVGGGTGGYYTQEQYREIVRYASERFITVVPEIDMPGHTNAALASYAELNCDGKKRELYTGTEVGFSTLCARKEITYKFVDDVVREIAEMTPGPYFHIGGDESHATKHDDYIYFIEKAQEIVRSHGKKVIGWDEIATTRLIEGTTAQYWDKAENALKAVEQGAKVLFSPAKRAYLDMQYDSTTKLGLHWAAYIEVDDSYDWDPAAMVQGIGRDDILGVEAPLWTETITNMDEIEYMLFPRLPGIAEIGWTDPLLRNWDDYKTRLSGHGPRFTAMGIDFYRSKLIPWAE